MLTTGVYVSFFVCASKVGLQKRSSRGGAVKFGVVHCIHNILALADTVIHHSRAA